MVENYTISDFIDECSVAFYPIRRDETAIKRHTEYIIENLRNFKGAVLQAAFKSLIRNRQSRGFPSIKEMIDACAKEARLQQVNQPRSLEFEPPGPGNLIKEYITGSEIADMLIFETKPDIAKKAAREGWIGGLWSFTRNKNRLPQQHEWDKCRKTAKEFDAAYESTVRGGWPYAQSLEALGANILARREEMRALILGKGA